MTGAVQASAFQPTALSLRRGCKAGNRVNTRLGCANPVISIFCAKIFRKTPDCNRSLVSLQCARFGNTSVTKTNNSFAASAATQIETGALIHLTRFESCVFALARRGSIQGKAEDGLEKGLANLWNEKTITTKFALVMGKKPNGQFKLKTLTPSFSLVLALNTALLLLGTTRTMAGNIDWIGGNGSWTVAGNWRDTVSGSNAVPVSSDSVYINDGQGGVATLSGANATVQYLELDNTSGLIIQAGAQLSDNSANIENACGGSQGGVTVEGSGAYLEHQRNSSSGMGGWRKCAEFHRMCWRHECRGRGDCVECGWLC